MVAPHTKKETHTSGLYPNFIGFIEQRTVPQKCGKRFKIIYIVMACDALYFKKTPVHIIRSKIGCFLREWRMVSLFLEIDFFFCFVFIHRLFIEFSEMLTFEMITFSKPTNFQQKPMCSCPIMNLQVPQKKGKMII